MLRFPFSTRQSPDIDQRLRERIATAIEGITTLRSQGHVKDLRHAGRDIRSTSESDVDGGYSFWRHELEGKRVTTGFRIGRVTYRRASEREQAQTGKAWIAYADRCEGRRDVREELPFLVRVAPHVEAARMTVVDQREAYVHRFSYDGLAGIDDPRARELVTWLGDHRVSRETLSVTTAADDGELLGLRIKVHSMTTCTSPPLYNRSRTDFHSFGQPVAPKPAVPADDEIYWHPAAPPKHS